MKVEQETELRVAGCPSCLKPFDQPMPNGYFICENCDACGHVEVLKG